MKCFRCGATLKPGESVSNGKCKSCPAVAAPVEKPAAKPKGNDRMNKTEAAYANLLEAMRLRGDIRAWRFEPLKLRLASATYYTPDFMVTLCDSMIEFHEVKGFWRDDARVKIKVAAECFPEYRFIAVTQSKGTWNEEVF